MCETWVGSAFAYAVSTFLVRGPYVRQVLIAVVADVSFLSLRRKLCSGATSAAGAQAS